MLIYGFVSLYKLLEQSDDPFYCPHCRLITQQLELKSTIESLSKDIMSLKSAINQPQKTRISEKNFLNNFLKMHNQFQLLVSPPISPVETKCQLQLRRQSTLRSLDKSKSIITEGENSVSPLSIRDLLRLGKYNENSKNPHPILVKLNWVIDVSALLSKAKSLPKIVRIKPDMTPAERKIESLL